MKFSTQENQCFHLVISSQVMTSKTRTWPSVFTHPLSLSLLSKKFQNEILNKTKSFPLLTVSSKVFLIMLHWKFPTTIFQFIFVNFLSCAHRSCHKHYQNTFKNNERAIVSESRRNPSRWDVDRSCILNKPFDRSMVRSCLSPQCCSAEYVSHTRYNKPVHIVFWTSLHPRHLVHIHSERQELKR